jgi:hypothetical protein
MPQSDKPISTGPETAHKGLANQTLLFQALLLVVLVLALLFLLELLLIVQLRQLIDGYQPSTHLEAPASGLMYQRVPMFWELPEAQQKAVPTLRWYRGQLLEQKVVPTHP